MRIAFRHHRIPPSPPPLQSAQIPGNRHTPMDIPGHCPPPPAGYTNFTKPAQNETVKNTVRLFTKIQWQCPYLEPMQNNTDYTTSNMCFRQVHIKQTNWQHGKTFLLILRLLSFQLASMSGLWRIHNEIIHRISKMFIPRWLQCPILLLPMLLMHNFTGKDCHRFSGQPWESSETPFPNQHIMDPYKSPIYRNNIPHLMLVMEMEWFRALQKVHCFSICSKPLNSSL